MISRPIISKTSLWIETFENERIIYPWSPITRVYPYFILSWAFSIIWTYFTFSSSCFKSIFAFWARGAKLIPLFFSFNALSKINVNDLSNFFL
jgi:hypothetical protein